MSLTPIIHFKSKSKRKIFGRYLRQCDMSLIRCPYQRPLNKQKKRKTPTRKQKRKREIELRSVSVAVTLASIASLMALKKRIEKSDQSSDHSRAFLRACVLPSYNIASIGFSLRRSDRASIFIANGRFASCERN